MASKYCPNCGRIVSTNSIPNFCAWGCGSLAEQPVLNNFTTYEEKLEIIERLKTEHQKAKQAEAPKEEIGGGRFQLKLF